MDKLILVKLPNNVTFDDFIEMLGERGLTDCNVGMNCHTLEQSKGIVSIDYHGDDIELDPEWQAFLAAMTLVTDQQNDF